MNSCAWSAIECLTVKQFEDWLRNDQDRGELTVKAYMADVRGFITWWQQTHGDRRFDLVAVTPTDIRDYRSRLITVDRQKTSSALAQRKKAERLTQILRMLLGERGCSLPEKRWGLCSVRIQAR